MLTLLPLQLHFTDVNRGHLGKMPAKLILPVAFGSLLLMSHALTTPAVVPATRYWPTTVIDSRFPSCSVNTSDCFRVP